MGTNHVREAVPPQELVQRRLGEHVPGAPPVQEFPLLFERGCLGLHFKVAPLSVMMTLGKGLVHLPVVIHKAQSSRLLELLLTVVWDLGHVEGERVVPEVLPHERVGGVGVGQILVDLCKDIYS